MGGNIGTGYHKHKFISNMYDMAFLSHEHTVNIDCIDFVKLSFMVKMLMTLRLSFVYLCENGHCSSHPAETIKAAESCRHDIQFSKQTLQPAVPTVSFHFAQGQQLLITLNQMSIVMCCVYKIRKRYVIFHSTKLMLVLVLALLMALSV